MSESNATRDKAEGTTRVAFNLTPAMVKEVERILEVTDLGSKPEAFRRAFTLLRIHVQAAQQNREIFMVDPKHPNDRYIITLPFNVPRESSRSET